MVASQCSAFPMNDKTWAVSLDAKAFQSTEARARVAIHYVIDNSSSMESTTKQVQEIFSEMVDSVATAPCSMTVFNEQAKILSSEITTGQQMRDLTLPLQGRTNIPEGIQRALRVVYGHECKALAQKVNADQRAHHVLILLSDGEHNAGPTPKEVFPGLNAGIPEDTKLSVIVVGYSASSNTSMGMLLKQSIETVPFDSNTVQTIYFATTKTSLQTALRSLETGLNKALKGSFHQIEASKPCLVDGFGCDASAKIRVHVEPGCKKMSLLWTGDERPDYLVVDGKQVSVAHAEDMPAEELAKLIQGLVDKTKIQIVASKNSTAMARKAAARLDELVSVLESLANQTKQLQTRSASAGGRLSQYRAIRGATHAVQSLRNQVADIANFSSDGGSQDQAAFLNGRDLKHAKKALRRAAKATNGVVLDPKAQLKALFQDLSCDAFQQRLRSAMLLDVLGNLLKLSKDEFEKTLLPLLRGRDVETVREICTKAAGLESAKILDYGLSTRATELIESGTLAEYLNKACHGNRHSYLSLSSPWQHLEEWSCFGEQAFESAWEMLLYAGFIGYPILLEQSAVSQMNPYLATVKGLRYSLADTASICLANQADAKVYGPEGGAPIQDILVLVDPSMPRASKLIGNSRLLGEVFTSATVSRDLCMYTGFSMRLALHTNSLFYLLGVHKDRLQREDVVASLHRAFMGRAFKCGWCGFGPVDHDYACSDLVAHHGDRQQGSEISNACPKCGWFSPNLDDWYEWDGTVCEEFIQASLKDSLKKEKQARQFLSEANLDLFLRIQYSLRKTCSVTIQEEYLGLAERMASCDDADGPLDLSPRSGIDGMSQVLLALVHPFDSQKNQKKAALSTENGFVEILREVVRREATQRFRMLSGGDKEKAKELATDFVKNLLRVYASTAPDTRPQMEAEPPMDQVRLGCDDSYLLDSALVKDEVEWVRSLAQQWSRCWTFAQGWRDLIDAREGGWAKLESDMEKGCFYYQDVIESAKKIELKMPRDVLGLESSDMGPLFLRVAVEAVLSGPAGMTSFTTAKADVIVADYDNEVLRDAAREMRMLFYLDRVRAKMAQWKVDGEQATFLKARAADIVEYSSLVNERPHVHGFDKQTFWGLWRAALGASSDRATNRARMREFLRTANEDFFFKHNIG